MQSFLTWQKTLNYGRFDTPIFKIRQYQGGYFYFNQPEKRFIKQSNMAMTQFTTYKFDQKPTAFDVDPLTNLMYVGLESGYLQILNRFDSTVTPPQIAPEPGQVQINDVLVLQDRVVNCFNNGDIRILSKESPQTSSHTLQKVHHSYTYKLKARDNLLYSCGHDMRVVATDLETQAMTREFIHDNSVWGIHSLNSNLLASVGLFLKGLLWDQRTSRAVDYWNLRGPDSSYITNLSEYELLMGDGKFLTVYEMRTRKTRVIQTIMVSAESILPISSTSFVAGGRGGELALYQGQSQGEEPLPPKHKYISIYDMMRGLRPTINGQAVDMAELLGIEVNDEDQDWAIQGQDQNQEEEQQEEEQNEYAQIIDNQDDMEFEDQQQQQQHYMDQQNSDEDYYSN